MFNLFKRTKAYSQKDMRDMYKRVFSTYEGKAVLLHILSIANVDESTFTMGDHDYTILKEGQRRLALNILKMAQCIFIHCAKKMLLYAFIFPIKSRTRALDDEKICSGVPCS